MYAEKRQKRKVERERRTTDRQTDRNRERETRKKAIVGKLRFETKKHLGGPF